MQSGCSTERTRSSGETVFNPLDHAGVRFDRRTSDRRELNTAPIDPHACTPYTRSWIIAMVGIQKAAIGFDRTVVRTEPDPTRRAVFERLRSAESRRARAVAGMLPWARSALEDALAHEQAAVDVDVWVARAEPEPQRRDIYQCDALEDFGHLYRYADALDLVAHGRERDVDEVVAVLPDRWGQPAAGAAGPAGVATTAPLSAFNTLTTLAVERQVADFYDHVDTGQLDP